MVLEKLENCFKSFIGSGPNWQGMEVTFSSDYGNDEEPERVVFLSNSSASKTANPVDDSSSLSTEGETMESVPSE